MNKILQLLFWFNYCNHCLTGSLECCLPAAQVSAGTERAGKRGARRAKARGKKERGERKRGEKRSAASESAGKKGAKRETDAPFYFSPQSSLGHNEKM